MMEEIKWYGCERVLETIEDATRECGSNYVKRCDIYDDTVNIHRPWYWLEPDEYEFVEVMDAAGALFHCDALDWRHPAHVVIKSRDDKRELLDAEKAFVQALHFNKHVRPRHVCDLTYREACYFGVDAVWCESNGVSSDEVDGSNVLPYLRHLFAKPSYANMNDDETLPYLRVLFEEVGESKASVRKRYHMSYRRLVYDYDHSQFSTAQYFEKLEKMADDAKRDGITLSEFYMMDAVTEDRDPSDAAIAHVWNRYMYLLASLKCKVYNCEISGFQYGIRVEQMSQQAVYEGLTLSEFYKLFDEMEFNVDYTRPRIHVASFD